MTNGTAGEVIGRTREGEDVRAFTLRAGALEARVMSYGATLMALKTPERTGRMANIVLGFDMLEPYLAGTPYFGATIGRYANRIAGARFVLDGVEYKLTANEGANQLHGGVRGFDKRVWRVLASDEANITFGYRSAEGEEGFPGELNVEVSYALLPDRLTIEYRASTSKPTHVNLTHHSYFNLSGDVAHEISGHTLQIHADAITAVDERLIPTGALRLVAGTPFDFRTPQPIGARIGADDAQLHIGAGYDHNFVLTKPEPAALTCAAQLCDPLSGRCMEVWSTEPGLQFYSGNHLSGAFAPRTGLCLEPQHFPDAPNQPTFPPTVLRPGETYRSRTELRFSARS